MAYRFRRKADPVREVRRVLLEQNRKASALLETWEQDPADHIHRCRQAFKRMRALLCLLRPGHSYVYKVENRACRDLARQLAYARDSAAMVEAADLLLKRVWEPGPRQSLLMLRKSLGEQAAREVADALAGMSHAVETVRAELPLLAERLAELPIADLRRRELRRGARRTLARARRDYRRLSEASGPEHYHQWRKHVKYTYYQTALMANLTPRWSQHYKSALSELAELLGQVQDLTVLDALLGEQPDELGIDMNWRRLRRTIRDVRLELQAQAARRGRQLFNEKRKPSAEIVTLPVGSRRA